MKYDIFISYRREGGKNYARTLKPELEKRGFRVFLDFDELKDGVFDKRIMDAIANAPIFLVILSKGSLDRCVNDGDWVKEEILYADKTNRHIVPVEVDKTFREMPETLPNNIKTILGAHQFSQIDTETLLQASIDQLVRDRISPYVNRFSEGHSEKEYIKKEGAEIHIEVDADCNLLRFKKQEMVLTAHEDYVIYLQPGKHKLEFVSVECPEISTVHLLTVTSNNYTDYLEIAILDKINDYKKVEEARMQEELRKKEEEKRRAAAEKKRIEEEKRLKEEEAKRIEEQRIQEEQAQKRAEEKKRKNKEKLSDSFLILMVLAPIISIGVGIVASRLFHSSWLGLEVFIVFGWFSFWLFAYLSDWINDKKDDFNIGIGISLFSIIIAIGIHSGIYFSSVWAGLGIGFALLITDFVCFFHDTKNDDTPEEDEHDNE